MSKIITTERISELLGPFLKVPLSSQQLQSVLVYLDLLLRWNSKINLTAVRDPEGIVTRHFGESLFAAEHLFRLTNQTESSSATDIGSGAGFPGFPIKLWAPHIEMTLIESNQRKATFLREVLRKLDLKGITVSEMRAESASVKADLVTLRAVDRFERVLPITRGLVNPGGRFAFLIGQAQVRIAQSALSDVRWEAPISIPDSVNRVLLVGAT